MKHSRLKFCAFLCLVLLGGGIVFAAIYTPREGKAQSASSELATGESATGESATGQSVVIEADGQVAWDKAEALYSAEGNVRVSRGLWRLEADRIEAYYAPEEVPEAGSSTLPSARDLRLVHALADALEGLTGATGSPSEGIESQVVASHQDGTILRTERLVWRPQEQILEATSGGDLKSRDGASLSSGGALTHRRLASGREESRARGGVVIRTAQGEMIRGAEAIALGKSGRIHEYRVLGGVEIVRTSGEQAQAEQLSYLVGARKVLLEDQVVLTSAGRTLSGDRAEMDLETGRSVLLPKSGEKVQGTFDPATNEPATNTPTTSDPTTNSTNP